MVLYRDGAYYECCWCFYFFIRVIRGGIRRVYWFFLFCRLSGYDLLGFSKGISGS